MIQWAATEDEAGVDVSVEALEGNGEFELDVTIEGTVEHLAPQARIYIVGKYQSCMVFSPLAPQAITHGSDNVGADDGVSLVTACHWYDDCTFLYDALAVRGSGNAFLLRLHGVSGLTYRFNWQLERGAGQVSLPLGSIAATRSSGNTVCFHIIRSLETMHD